MDVSEAIVLGQCAGHVLEPLIAEAGELVARGIGKEGLATAGKAESRATLVRFFDDKGKSSVEELGNKGFWLADMTKAGAPVPPGFTITTGAADSSGVISNDLRSQIPGAVKGLEHRTESRFGDTKNPLLVSVRSGAAVSMPGMMDTVLNVGINEDIVHGLAESRNPAFAWSTYSRFLRSYGETVLGVPRQAFQAVAPIEPGSARVASALEGQSRRYQRIIEEAGGQVPQEPRAQLNSAISSIFKSWNNERAVSYRQLRGIPERPGTAVTVQKMVFGNQADSGTGIALSHNAMTGEAQLNGEWLENAQDELVSGSRTPLSLAHLREFHPQVYDHLRDLTGLIERRLGRPTEIEFTVERNKLYVLQARGQRLSPEVTIRRAVEDVEAGKIGQAEALSLVSPAQLEAVRLPRFDKAAVQNAEVVAEGLAASPGAAVGKIVGDSRRAVSSNAQGNAVVLVRDETFPGDLDGMMAARAIITRVGGTTSHAAIVALEQGKPCITGCANLSKLGGTVSVDGFTGKIYKGELPLEPLQHAPEVEKFMSWHNAAEARKWPEPSFVPDVQRTTNLASDASNFYLSKLMAHQLRLTPLAAEADSLRINTNVVLAEKMAGSLIDGVAREVKAFPPANLERQQHILPDIQILQDEFGVKLGYWGAGDAEHNAVIQKIAETPQQRDRFLDASYDLFDRGYFGNGFEHMDERYHVFGGRGWAQTTQVLKRYFSGDLNHGLFVDHSLDLYHNKGSMFSDLTDVLDIKRDTRTTEELYRGLSKYDLDPRVRDLYNKGADLGLWAPAVKD